MLRVCSLLVITIFPLSNLLAGSVNLSAIKDGTMYEESGSLANGGGAHIFCGMTGTSDLRRALLQFDISGSIPAGSTIDSVVLTLNLSRTRFGSQTVTLHRILADWGEGTTNAGGQEGQGGAGFAGDVSWTHRFLGSLTWTTPGGDFSPASSASQSVGNIGSYSWGSTANMVADVQSWLDTPGGNFGWLILGNESASLSAKRFDSRQNSTVPLRPRLVINFTPPVVDPCPLDDPDDTDGDGVCDSDDICPGGDDNLDTDGDDVPNFCDPCPSDNPDDADGDGVCTTGDPCLGFPNSDTDSDGICDSGDPCTGFPNLDGDGDGVCNSIDPCTGFPNVDGDGDGMCDSGDPCTGFPNVDVDGDGVCNSIDPCTGSPNVDSDGDGVCNSADPCNGFPNVDADGDGVCDAQDPCTGSPNDDADDDGVCDSADFCVGSPNVDSDGDGVCDSSDPCTGFPNLDADFDGLCDALDACRGFPNSDDDADGVCDHEDLCPGEDDGVDSEGDGIPDCAQAIPTVSEWGLVILALLLLVSWKTQMELPRFHGASAGTAHALAD